MPHRRLKHRGRSVLLALIGAGLVVAIGAASAGAAPSGKPAYDKEGRFLPPQDYRDWVFISSGANMSYTDEPAMAGYDLFDNTFVPKQALDVFRRTGTWPDKTVIMLETRVGAGAGSMNHRGLYQSGEIMGLEAHVKDLRRFPGGWAFFGVGAGKPAKMIARTASCYSCHEEHGAVDTTFVQFYPTLMPIAVTHGTLSPAYRAEAATPSRKP